MKDKYIYNLFKITTNILFVGHRRRQSDRRQYQDSRRRQRQQEPRRSRFINKI